MKRLIILCLLLGACAHAPVPATQVIDIPIVIQPRHIDLPSCPELPILALTPDSTWDQRLPAWYASITIQAGCIESRDNIIRELNK
jgi:hypothetical protein